MDTVIVSILHLLHIMGAIIWIGGILMILLVVLPGAKSLESAAMTGRLMKEVARRFTPLANLSIFILAATGTLLLFYDHNLSIFQDSQGVLLAAKIFLVSGMVIIHFYRGLLLNPRIEKLSPQDSQTAKLKKFSLNLVKTNFALGIAVLVLTTIKV